MHELIDGNERVAAALLAAATLVVGFGAGFTVSNGSGPTGAVSVGSDAGTDAVTQAVQSFMDTQLQQQNQQLQMMAQRSPNISADDLSMEATVTDVSQAEFDGLYQVTVSIQGQVPGRTGGLQQLDREQTLYVSQDGRYLFGQPTDLQNPQPTQQPQPTQ